MGHCLETNVQRDELPDRAEAVGDRAAPVVEFPDKHDIEPPDSRLAEQSIGFETLRSRPVSLGADDRGRLSENYSLGVHETTGK